jgi:hypothetical protein
MCDDAETVAGAGTDMRRCSDALGPRKNLHRRVSHRRISHRCHLIGVSLIGSHFIGASLIGVLLKEAIP